MELTPLRYFVKLADVLSFTEAARELFITQSTLSQSIKQLEAELGAPLFDRVGKKVYLTDSGLDFLSHARKALEENKTVAEVAVEQGLMDEETAKNLLDPSLMTHGDSMADAIAKLRKAVKQ